LSTTFTEIVTLGGGTEVVVVSVTVETIAVVEIVDAGVTVMVVVDGGVTVVVVE
jgi:hypothetical protein